jgi:hypothetical protein
VLLEEYKNIHNRVLHKFQEIERICFQTIVAIGVILYFCISSFKNTDNYISLSIDLCIILIVPILSFSLLLMVLSAYIEVAAFGEYLISIEKKINSIFNKSSIHGDPNSSTLDWEYWRIYHGIVKDNFIFFNRAFIICFVFICTLIIPFIRISFIKDYPDAIPEIFIFPNVITDNYINILILFITTVYIIMIIIILFFMCKLRKRRINQERLLAKKGQPRYKPVTHR